MAWMLQPKNYIQIARPNLYNVAYRRVGAYKGLGRMNPTNYLQIGRSPNRIGGTTGQYSTFSGQLSLAPPSLRGLGFEAVPYDDWQWSRSETDSAPDWWAKVDAAIEAGKYAAERGKQQPGTKSPVNLGMLAAIGAGLLVVVLAARR